MWQENTNELFLYKNDGNYRSFGDIMMRTCFWELLDASTVGLGSWLYDLLK
jgi:hypothetical protein